MHSLAFNNLNLNFAQWTAAEAAVGLCAGTMLRVSPLLTGIYVINRIISEIATPLFSKYFDAYYPEKTVPELRVHKLDGTAPTREDEKSASEEDGELMQTRTGSDKNRDARDRLFNKYEGQIPPGITSIVQRWLWCEMKEAKDNFLEDMVPRIDVAIQKNSKEMGKLLFPLLIVSGIAALVAMPSLQNTAIRIVAAAAILASGAWSATDHTYLVEIEKAPYTPQLSEKQNSKARENLRTSFRFVAATTVWFAGAALLGAHPATTTAVFLAARLVNYSPRINQGSVVDNFITRNIADRFIIKPLGDSISASTAEKIRFLSLTLPLIPLSFAARLV